MPWLPAYEGEIPSLGWALLDLWGELFRSPRDETEPIMLTDSQAQQVLQWFALDPDTGQFVYRRALSRRSKGSGKSPLAGLLGISELRLPVRFAGWSARGRPVGQPWGWGGLPPAWVQYAAVSEDQTSNAYEPLRQLLLAKDGAAADALGLDVGLQRVVIRNAPGRLEIATSRSGSREGQPLTAGFVDEGSLLVKENGGVRLAATIRRNLSKLGGRCWETSNGWVPGEGSVAEGTETAALAGRPGILLDVVEAPRTVRGVTVDLNAPDDVLRDALAVAYGDAWWVDLDRLVADIRDPDMRWGDSARWFCNWCDKAEGRAVDPVRWAELERVNTVESGARIGIGFDGSVSRDTTALIACTPDGFSFELGVWERPTDSQGRPDPEWRVPRGEVTDCLRQTIASYDVGRVLCDPARWYSEIEEWAAEFDRGPDDPVVVIFDSNKPRAFSAAVDRWLTAIAEGSHTHDQHAETLTAHVLNAALKPVAVRADPDDDRTAYIVAKDSTGRRIDCCVAGVLAHEAAMTMPAPALAALAPFVAFS